MTLLLHIIDPVYTVMILVLEVALYMKFATGFSPESYIKKN